MKPRSKSTTCQDMARESGEKRRAFNTYLPRTLELDNLVPVLVHLDLFLRAVTPILDEEEQERADEPREGVPFHGRVTPCAREPLRRDEHAGCGRGEAGVECDGGEAEGAVSRGADDEEGMGRGEGGRRCGCETGRGIGKGMWR